MQQRIFFIIARIRYLRRPAVFAVLFVAAILAFGYLTRGFVRAYVEIKHANVFATAIDAQGWDDPTHAASLDLPADAPYESFTTANAASVEIGAVATETPVEVAAPPVPAPASPASFIPAGVPLPPVKPTPTPPATTTATTTAAAAAPESDASTTAQDAADEGASTTPSSETDAPADSAPAAATTSPDLPAAAPDDAAPTSTPVQDESASTTPVSFLQATFERLASWAEAHTAAVAFATSSDTTTPAIAPPGQPASSTQPLSTTT
ncbi:MAG TPA: hypothetical protein VG871_24870, partial [Vicinamibacterales bacterium]|nr:hypothetical protein [Vicinamibacterales bacterium]